METGGGLMHARDLLGDAPVLVVNSDNLWIDGPTDAIRELAAGWDDARVDALLLLVTLARANNHRGKGDFRSAADGRIPGRRGRRSQESRVGKDCGSRGRSRMWTEQAQSKDRQDMQR